MRGLVLEQALDKLTRSPAQLFSSACWKPQPGSHADIMVFDPHRRVVVDPTKFFLKKSEYAIWGWTVRKGEDDIG